jgi:hypothetical protein
LRKVIEYRTELSPFDANQALSNLNLSPKAPRAKLKPMNVREMELQLNKKAQHCTFHTDSKLLKEFEINSLKPNQELYSYISQDERLDYEAYFNTHSKPQSFVDFIIKRRRTQNPEAKTSTIYGKN